MDAFLVSLAVVFVAEIGDKSQLLSLTFAARFPLLPVVAGIALATAALLGVSVAVGTVAGDLIPERAALAVSALLFLAFGVWTLRADADADADRTEDADGAKEGEEGGASAAPGRRRLPFLAVFGAFTLAELGDKTMLATVTLAANAPPLATWAGATMGMLGANLLAVALGRALGSALPARVVRVASAVLFLAVGVVLAVQTARAG